MMRGASETGISTPFPDLTPLDGPTGIPALLAIALVDTDGRIRHWSPGCEALYGWTAPEAIGAIKYQLLTSSLAGREPSWPPPVGTAPRSLIETHRDGGRLRVMERAVPLDARDGYALTLMPEIAGGDGRADDNSIVPVDGSAQRLERPLQRWWPSGVEGGSFSVDQLMTGPAGPMFARLLAKCRAALTEGRDQPDMELPAHGESPGVRTVRTRARRVRHEDGVAKRFVGLMQDLTDASVRARVLRNRRGANSTILKTVSDAMIVVDRDGIIGVFSRAAQDLLGHDRLAMIGQPIDTLLDGGWTDIVAAADYGGTRELWVTDATGRRLPVEMRIGSLSIDTVSDYVLFLTDISKRRAQEARQTQFEHAARNIAMAEFAAHLMHELNQPLAAASNFLAVAQQLKNDPAKVADTGGMIDMALGQIQRLGGIVRGAQRKVIGEDIDPQPISIRAAVDEAVALVQIACGIGGVEIVIDIGAEAETIFVDPIGIQQVLANLLRNAVEALGSPPRPGAMIHIRSERTDRRLLLSVCDNGPGIPADTIADLFEPFRRSTKKNGMGLGLSICRTIVEAHDGTLSAKNLLTGGVCFTLALPLYDRDEAT